ncbi:HK97 family phage prohead protease [Pedobacter africanus]|uniref:Prohead serine protease n=1 Tax=Pedobacter africanus TaxID=151894 RepID=A0A1W1ZBI3_9SPHI|nr:HK97 family phage prohead protease [Pedobacter africanus]SMC45799.1 prohead serine protease [Pedobacter africanus]
MKEFDVVYEFDDRSEQSVLLADDENHARQLASEAMGENGANDFLLTVEHGNANWIKSHNMIGLLEEKDNVGSVKDVSLADMTITGYLAHFGSVDYGNDITEKGAFTKTLLEGKGKHLFLNFHNFDQPHNKFSVLQEDDFGLYFEVKMIKDVSYSMDTLRLYDAGVLTDQSYGFHAVKKVFEKKEGVTVRRLKEVVFGEGSNVAVGMNKNAKFTGFKGMTIEKCKDQVSKIMKFLRTGNVTDETFLQLEIGLKQLQAYSFELGKQALETKSEPDKTTLITSEPQAIEIIKSFRNTLKN